MSGSVRVGRGVLVQVSSRGEDVEPFLVRLGESLLSFEETSVNGNDAWVVLARVVDGVGVSQGGLWVEEVVGSSGKRDPLSVGQELGHVDTELSPRFLNRGRHSGLPFVESRPGRLDGSDDTFLKVSRVLLHDNNRLLESILLLNLLLQLLDNCHVDREGVLLGTDLHRGVVDGTNRPSKVGNGLGGELSLLGDRGSEFARVVLNVFDVGLDLGSEFLQVLHDRGFNGSSERRVRVGNDSSLVPDRVKDVLHTALTEELVSRSEWDLDDSAELGEFFGSVCLDIGNTFKVG